MATAGGMTVGMFRMMDGQRLVVFEALAFEREADGTVTHRLRHFGGSMRAWEEEPIVFELVEEGEGLLVLRNRGGDGPTWVRYALTGRTRWTCGWARRSGRRSRGSRWRCGAGVECDGRARGIAWQSLRGACGVAHVVPCGERWL